MTRRDRLTPEQREVWDTMQVHVPVPSGDQTEDQSINLAVLSFLYWCAFDGLEPRPTEAAMKAEFEARGAQDVIPAESYWEHLRENPGAIWMLAPGAYRRR